MIGTYVLAGGEEFQGIYDEPDRSLLALLPMGARQIVIMPTTATEETLEMAIASGVHHFRSLAPDAHIEGAIVLDAVMANDNALAGRIASANLVYLSGDDPIALLRALRGSEVLAAIAAVVTRGGIVAGSNAGAMALCSMVRSGNGWQPGLGLLPNVAMLAHHDGEPLPLSLVRAGLPSTMTLLGIPSGVNCVATYDLSEDDGIVWRVLGDRPVTLYHANSISQIGVGTTFTLEPNIAVTSL